MDLRANNDFIGNELKKYNLSDAALAKMEAEYMPIVVGGVDDIENYMIAKEAHQEVKKIRIDIDKKRKELKQSSLEFGRAVDGEAKRLTVVVEKIEEHLLTQRKVVEDEKKRRQEEAEQKEREEQARLKKEEEDRIEAIRKEQEEKERKLKEEREKIEADKRAIEEERQRIEDEKERIKQEKIDEALRVTREKRQAEEIEREKKLAAEQAIKDERDRLIKEKREEEIKQQEMQAAAKRAEELKPDIEKLKTLAESIENFTYPTVQDESAAMVLNSTKQKMLKIAKEIMNWKPMTQIREVA